MNELSSASSSCCDSNWSYHKSDDIDRYTTGNSKSVHGDTRKPEATWVIVKVKALRSTLEGNCSCMQFNGQVQAILRTTCLATSIVLKCKDKNCGFIYYSTTPAEIDKEDDTADHRERLSHYVINIFYVLGFMSCGDGGTCLQPRSPWLTQ